MDFLSQDCLGQQGKLKFTPDELSTLYMEEVKLEDFLRSLDQTSKTLWYKYVSLLPEMRDRDNDIHSISYIKEAGFDPNDPPMFLEHYLKVYQKLIYI
jgi:hypothetical protein